MAITTTSDSASINTGWESLHFTSRDGLRLHVRHYKATSKPQNSPNRPVILLPGLTRNAADFHVLATDLSTAPGLSRDAYAFDYRGRGKSDYDPDWENYTPYTECLDVLDFLTARDIKSVDIIGTSRGGIISMLMATLRPAVMHSVVMNDIGPVIEAEGLARIIGYVGKIPLPKSWDDAILLVREMNQSNFTKLSDREWSEFTHCLYADENGEPANTYDRNLSKAISGSTSGDTPTLWPQFEAMSGIPLLIIRGQNSDLLSETAFAEMQTRHQKTETHIVPDQGHAPLLTDEPTIRRIAEFLMKHDSD